MDFSQFVKSNSLELGKETINISELVSFLQSNLNITTLSLKNCNIDNKGAKALANGNLTNLTQLDLTGNNIGDEGAQALANGNFTNLTQLDLCSNNIGDEGAQALAEALVNGNLINFTSLDLQYNKIGDKGAQALTSIKKLTSCRLDSNSTSIKGRGDFDLAGLMNNKLSGPPIEIFDPTKSESKITLDDIIIPESLKKELSKILNIIPEKNKALLQKTGYKPEKGYLFYGPPGNGKTKIARAIACQTNAKFISVSASEFLQSYVGAGEAHVRKLFKEARANAPCIVFIDEIDCIATERGSGGSSGHAQSCNSLVNQFLTELDGFNPLEGVTVIAATNRRGVLDKAFIRPGRLSKHIEIPLPDKAQRKDILDLYIKKFKDTEELKVTVDTTKLANKTDGFSGAELECLINGTAWDIIHSSEIEGKVTIGISNFIQAIKNLNKEKSQEPKSKQVNVDLESLNSPLDNEDNVKSHSSANSNSNVVETEVIQQNVLSTIQAEINELEKKFEELDCNNSDLEQGLKSVEKDIECAKEHTQLQDNLKTITKESTKLKSELENIKQDLTKITQCAEEHTQFKNNLKAIIEKSTQLQSELESMRKILDIKGNIATQLKECERILENRVENLQKQFEGKNKELNSKYEQFLGASNNSKRQGSYASISFVLSGAFAVGASLTMFHLAMCLSLAIAALIFLTAGCYCLYNTNTTLSNVEIDQTTNLVSCLNDF